MKKVFLRTMFIAGLLTLILKPAFAYTIDGLVNDWGVNLTTGTAVNSGYLDQAANRPSGGLDIDYVTEDNAGPGAGWQLVGPGYTYNGNTFDTEAIYFDNDANNAYIAVITGLPITGGTAPGNPWFYPGDIGLDLNNDRIYEYGIDVREYDTVNNKARLYTNLTASNWSNVAYPQYSEANPFAISSGIYSDWIDFVYSGNQNSHYVLEAAIPLSYLGVSANPGDAKTNLTLHWTMQCGNDYLNLPADINPAPVPEPASLSLLGLGLLGLLGFKKKK